MTISKNMSKILSLVLALTMCLSLGISASAAEADLTAEERELLELRDAVVYDAFFGEQYITAAMNQPIR